MDMSRTRKAIVIRSPQSGRADQLSQALTYLRQMDVDIADVISIASLDGLPNQGRYWRELGIDIAIAAGGDGVVGGVITHIARSGLLLGILPLGTANDIARSLGISADPLEAAATIAHGKQVEVDIGIARPAEQAPHIAGSRQGRPMAAQVAAEKEGFFAHALTIGLNVQFSRLATNVATRQRYGKLTYPLAAFEVLREHTALEVELRFEGLALQQKSSTAQQTKPTITHEVPPLHFRALQVTVINAPIFGGVWQLAIRNASLQDRLLDIVVIEDIDLGMLNAAIARIFNHAGQSPADQADWHARYPALQQAELTHIPGIHHVQVRGLTISTNIDPQDVTLDGEVRGQTPAYVHMADERLRVVVPQ